LSLSSEQVSASFEISQYFAEIIRCDFAFEYVQHSPYTFLTEELATHLFDFFHQHLLTPLQLAVSQNVIAQHLQLERMRVEPRIDKTEFVFRKIDVRVMKRQKLQGFYFGEIAERDDAEDIEKRRGQPLFQRINFERLPRSRHQRQPPMIDHCAQVIEKRIVEFRRILKQGFEFIQAQHEALARVSPRLDRLIEGRQVAARLVVVLDRVSRALHRVEYGAQKIHDGLRGGIGQFDVNKPVTRLAQPCRARLVQVIEQRRLANAPLADDRTALQRPQPRQQELQLRCAPDKLRRVLNHAADGEGIVHGCVEFLQASVVRRARDIIALGGKSMSTTTVASPQEMISALPLAGKRELAVWLLNQFDSNAILELLREVQPASEPVYDYEDPGPLTDEMIDDCALQSFLRMDEEEAAYEQSTAQ